MLFSPVLRFFAKYACPVMGPRRINRVCVTLIHGVMTMAKLVCGEFIALDKDGGSEIFMNDAGVRYCSKILACRPT